MLNQCKTDITNVKSVQNRYYKCLIGTKLILQMFNRYKTDITNVKLVQNRYYKC